MLVVAAFADAVVVLRTGAAAMSGSNAAFAIYGLTASPNVQADGSLSASGQALIPAAVVGVAWSQQVRKCSIAQSVLAEGETNVQVFDMQVDLRGDSPWHHCEATTNTGMCVKSASISAHHVPIALVANATQRQTTTNCEADFAFFGIPVISRSFPVSAPVETATTGGGGSRVSRSCSPMSSLLPNGLTVAEGAEISITGTQRLGIQAAGGASPEIEVQLSGTKWVGPDGCVLSSVAVHVPTADPAKVRALLGEAIVAEAEGITKQSLRPEQVEDTLSALKDALLGAATGGQARRAQQADPTASPAVEEQSSIPVPVDRSAQTAVNDMVRQSLQRMRDMLAAQSGHVAVSFSQESASDAAYVRKLLNHNKASQADRTLASIGAIAAGDASPPVFVGLAPAGEQSAEASWFQVAATAELPGDMQEALLQQLVTGGETLVSRRALSGGLPTGHVEFSGIDFEALSDTVAQGTLELRLKGSTDNWRSTMFVSSDDVEMTVTPTGSAAMDCKLISAGISVNYDVASIYANFEGADMVACLDKFRMAITTQSGAALSLGLTQKNRATNHALSISLSDADVRWPTADMQVTPLVMPLWHLRNIGTAIIPALAVKNSIAWSIVGVDGQREDYTLGDMPLSGCLEGGSWGDELDVDTYWQYLGGSGYNFDDPRPTAPIAGYYLCARSYNGPEHSMLPAIGDHMIPQEFEAGVQQLTEWDAASKTAAYLPVYASGSLNVMASLFELMQSPHVQYTPAAGRRAQTASSIRGQYSDNYQWELSAELVKMGISFSAKYSAHVSLCMAPADARGDSPGLTACSPEADSADRVAHGMASVDFTLGSTAALALSVQASASPDRALAALGAGAAASGLLRSMALAAAGESTQLPERTSVFVKSPRKRYINMYKTGGQSPPVVDRVKTTTTDSTLATSGVTAGTQYGQEVTEKPDDWQYSTYFGPDGACPGSGNVGPSLPDLLPLESTPASESHWLSSMFALPDQQAPIAALRLTVTVKDDSAAAASAVPLQVSGRATIDAGGAVQAAKQARGGDATIGGQGTESELYDLLVGDSLHASEMRTPQQQLQLAQQLLQAAYDDVVSESDTSAYLDQAKFMAPEGSPLNPYSNMWVPWLGVVGWGPVFDLLPLIKAAALAANGRQTSIGSGYYWGGGVDFTYANRQCMASINKANVCSPNGGLSVAIGAECPSGGASCSGTISAPASICVDDSSDRINLMQYPVPALLPFSTIRLQLPGTAVLHAAAALMGSNADAWYVAVGMSESMLPTGNAPVLHTAPASPAMWGAGGAELGLHLNCTGFLELCSTPAMGLEVVYSSAAHPLSVPAAAAMPDHKWMLAVRSDATVPNGLKFVRQMMGKMAQAGTMPMRALARAQHMGLEPASLPRNSTYMDGLNRYALVAGMEAVMADSAAARGQIGISLKPASADVPEVWTEAGAMQPKAATAAQRGVDTFVSSGDVDAWKQRVRTLPALMSMRVWVNGSRLTVLDGEDVNMGPFAADLLDTLVDECRNVAGSYGRWCNSVGNFIERQVSPAGGEVDVIYPQMGGTSAVPNAQTQMASSDDIMGTKPTGVLYTSHWIAGMPAWELTDMITTDGYLVWEGGVSVAQGLECQPLNLLPESLSRSSPGCLRWMVPGSAAVYTSSEFMSVRLQEPAGGCAGAQTFEIIVAAHTEWMGAGGSSVPAAERVAMSFNAAAAGAPASLVMVGRPAKVSYWMNTQRVAAGAAACAVTIAVAPARREDVAGSAAAGRALTQSALFETCKTRQGADWQACVVGVVAPEATAGMWSSGVEPSSVSTNFPAPQPTMAPDPFAPTAEKKTTTVSLGAGAIAGIVVGIAVAVAIVASLVLYRKQNPGAKFGCGGSAANSKAVNNPLGTSSA